MVGATRTNKVPYHGPRSQKTIFVWHSTGHYLAMWRCPADAEPWAVVLCRARENKLRDNIANNDGEGKSSCPVYPLYPLYSHDANSRESRLGIPRPVAIKESSVSRELRGSAPRAQFHAPVRLTFDSEPLSRYRRRHRNDATNRSTDKRPGSFVFHGCKSRQW